MSDDVIEVPTPDTLLAVCGVLDGARGLHNRPLDELGLVGGEVVGGARFGGFDNETWIIVECPKHSWLSVTVDEARDYLNRHIRALPASRRMPGLARRKKA